MDENTARENYTRVTTILYPFSGLDKIDATIVQRAADRGTKTHKICEGIIDGLGEFGVDTETRPYVESFKKWWHIGHDVVAVERRFWDDDLQITGQVDIIINTPSGLAIVDLKTSSRPSKTWRGQGCAYAYLAKKAGYEITTIQFIHLLKNGATARVYEYEVDDEFFLSTYLVWNHFFKKGRLHERT